MKKEITLVRLNLSTQDDYAKAREKKRKDFEEFVLKRDKEKQITGYISREEYILKRM